MGELRKVVTGESIRFSSRTHNAFVDAARAHRLRQQTGVDPRGVAPAGDVVLVQNLSGANRDRWEILELDGPVITPADNQDEFENNVTFRGVTPTGTGRFAVLLEAIPENAFGRALVSGVTPALVEFEYGEHNDAFADAVNGKHTLEAAASGAAQVLWQAGETGKQFAVVRLSNPPRVADTLTSGGLCPPGSVSLEVVTDVQCGSTSGEIETCTRTVCLPAGTLVTAQECGLDGTSPGGGTVEAECCPDGVSENLLATVNLSGTLQNCAATYSVALTWNGSLWVGTNSDFPGGLTVEMNFCDSQGALISYRADTCMELGESFPRATPECKPFAVSTVTQAAHVDFESCCGGGGGNLDIQIDLEEA